MPFQKAKTPKLQVEQAWRDGPCQLLDGCASQMAAEEVQSQHLGNGGDVANPVFLQVELPKWRVWVDSSYLCVLVVFGLE